MNKKLNLLPSGIPLVDLAWGGFYTGGTYLLVGPHKSGKTLLALQYSLQSAKENEVCLYFTSMRPKDLIINATSINLDLQEAMSRNKVIVIKVTHPKNIEHADNPDAYLAEYIQDIKSVVDQYQPYKIVFDEITPFVGFQNPELLKEAFLKTTEYIEDQGITSLYVIGEPVTPAARKITNILASASTGFIELNKHEDFISKSNPAEMTIIPNVGHTEGKFKSGYFIEPNKGVQVNYVPPNSSFLISSGPVMQKKYKSLSEIEIPHETFTLPNVYSFDDFRLILNNQIAYYKSTGKSFSIVSVKLDETAEKGKLLTIRQLQNTVRLSTEKKDKICTVSDKVIVLFTKEVVSDLNNFLAKLKSNLPNDDPNFLNTIIQFISVYHITIDDEIESADDIFDKLLSNGHTEKYKFGFS
jgi:circadian clock protein KaiC